MKIVVITDVHANLPALEAVLTAAKQHGYDVLIHTGGFRWAVLVSRILRRDVFGERDRDAVRSMWRRGLHHGGTGSSGTPTLSLPWLWATDDGVLSVRF